MALVGIVDVLVKEASFFGDPLASLSPRACLTVLCSSSFPPSLCPSVQQASYAASSFSVSYCVQHTKVAFTPEDGSAAPGLSASVSNSFLSRHGALAVPSVSRPCRPRTWDSGCPPLPTLYRACEGSEGLLVFGGPRDHICMCVCTGSGGGLERMGMGAVPSLQTHSL